MLWQPPADLFLAQMEIAFYISLAALQQMKVKRIKTLMILDKHNRV
jgi:hypothetical protein